MSISHRSRKKKGVIRGRSTAFLITIGVHAAFLIIAVFYTAMVVLQREEPKFEGAKIERPKMELKKLQVPIKVKKIQQPKFQQKMSAPGKTASIDFKMPAISGIKGGVGSFDGGGLGSLGFDMRFDTLFGGDAASGNELVGTFYDLKQTADGVPVPMSDDAYRFRIKTFLDSWSGRDLRDFYQAPKKKNAIALMIPEMDAAAAPDAFGVGDVVEPKHWAIHYTGNITAPETGRYRFCGRADDVLFVRVNRKVVLDGCHEAMESWWDPTGWKKEHPNMEKIPFGSTTLVVGDWIRLQKGQAVPMEVLIGEIPGGEFYCHLLVEQFGKTYKQVPSNGGMKPVLPVFKMSAIPEGLREKMKINPDEETVDGPVFGAGW